MWKKTMPGKLTTECYWQISIETSIIFHNMLTITTKYNLMVCVFDQNMYFKLFQTLKKSFNRLVSQ